jgi:hypothetical protein
LPAAESTYLRILAPDLLEMVRISSDAAVWNQFVTNAPPSTNQFQVTTSSGSVAVTQLGFKRRALYAALAGYDLRLENSIYLRLASTNWAGTNATIEVTTTNTALWPTTMRFTCLNNPLRYSPAIHVNQAGYSPNYQKKAMIGYYLGNLGEMQISTNLGFRLVDTSGNQIYPSFGLAPLAARADDTNSWWPNPSGVHEAQYQGVLEADFSGFTNTGQYRLVVPGMGASYSFRVDEGTMMDLARTYALGLYHQRCGSGPDGLLVNDTNFTRFPHTNCHAAKALIPIPATSSSFSYTWGLLAGYGAQTYTNAASNANPPQIASPLTNATSMLFAFQTNATNVDVSGGHHDAGDYSKYTINSAQLVHLLTFAADNLGLTNLDNLGLPESTNGIPDILEELKWEADFLAKMQDTNDGGFYFLVYAIDTEYENKELPGPHTQVVWPKTTAATAAATAALAEVGSSPIFKALNSSDAARYLRAATNGWKFLTNAIARYGKDGCYQRITHYGDNFTHDDELAWAAASLFAATGGRAYWTNLHRWFPNPGDTNGHNGFDFLWVKESTNNLPTTGTNLAAIKYVPITNGVDTNGFHTNISGRLQFRIFDVEGTRVVDKFDTNLSVYASNKIAQFKIYLNGQYDDPRPGFPSTLDTISAIVGQCHGTRLDGWRRMSEAYGCACRAYAFAARSGRRTSSELDTNYLAQCETEITNRAADLRLWSGQNAYGTSLSPDQKGVITSQYGVSYYFGGDLAFDLAVGDRIQPNTNNAAAIIENLNYEAGRNPLNVSFLTGLGWSRQREIVDQYSWNNPSAVLPRSGIPLGNIVDGLEPPGGFQYDNLQNFSYPAFGNGAGVFPLYDRWADAYNVVIEFVHPQTARSFAAAGALASASSLTNQVWRNSSAAIVFPNGLPSFSKKCIAQLSTTQDLSQAQVLWDPGQANWNFLGQDPVFGTNYTFIPGSTGDGRTLQAEAVLPDGRRIFAMTSFAIWDPSKGGTAFINDTSTIALYHFDTNYNDSSGSNFNLTAAGTVALANNANWMSSPTGNVARFRNYGDELTVTIPRLTLFDTNGNIMPVSIEFRIYPRAYKGAPSGFAPILQLSQDYYSYWTVQYAPPPLSPLIEASGGTSLLSTTNWPQYLPANTWHSVKITTQPSGSTELFIDGNAVGGSVSTVYSPHYNPSTSPPNDFNWVLTLGNFDGDIDELRISKIIRQ